MIASGLAPGVVWPTTIGLWPAWKKWQQVGIRSPTTTSSVWPQMRWATCGFRHVEELAQFLKGDKAKKVSEALLAVRKKLIEAQEALKIEGVRLSLSLKEASAMLADQQKHAKPPDQIDEPLDLNILIDDALATRDPLLRKKNIRVERWLTPLPMVGLDRHKMQRVLFYLLKNSWEAFDETTAGAQIVVGTQLREGQILLTICDNGKGMPTTLLEKAFNLGFTTKSGANGFGLHYCANAIHEMGGRITLFSPGPYGGDSV